MLGPLLHKRLRERVHLKECNALVNQYTSLNMANPHDSQNEFRRTRISHSNRDISLRRFMVLCSSARVSQIAK